MKKLKAIIKYVLNNKMDVLNLTGFLYGMFIFASHVGEPYPKDILGSYCTYFFFANVLNSAFKSDVNIYEWKKKKEELNG